MIIHTNYIRTTTGDIYTMSYPSSSPSPGDGNLPPDNKVSAYDDDAYDDDDDDDDDEIDEIDVNEPLEVDYGQEEEGDDDEEEEDARSRILSRRTDQLMDTFRDYVASMEGGGGGGRGGGGPGEGGVVAEEVGRGVLRK